MDETGFCADPSRCKAVGQKGAASTRTTSGPGRENITVLAACNAAGIKMPPLIIYQGKNMWDKWVAPPGEDYPGTTYAATKSGWIESEVFRNYFEHSFIPNLGPSRPVLVIFDRHSTHMDPELALIALKNDITLLKLPAHSISHLSWPSLSP